MEDCLSVKRIVKRFVPKAAIERYREHIFQRNLPLAARQRDELDRQGPGDIDAGNKRVISANVSWLCRAQDYSASHDGGVARHFSLLTGWAPSYPETTGYVVPTVLAEAAIQGDKELEQRARTMLDWLTEIQLPNGSYRGGMVHEGPAVPVTFNTGQILLGLAAGALATGSPLYSEAMHRAASWLVETQDDDGCWRKFPTPFAASGEKTYETHVAWGLFEAERVSPGHGYGEAGLKQVRWALTKQQANGWFRDCCLADPASPLTHTIGYALRGIIEAYRLSGDNEFLAAAVRAADSLARNVRDDGFLPGRFDNQWRPAARWSCLTGAVQIAHCWLQLYGVTGDARYRDVGRKVNAFVRRTVAIGGEPDQLGGVRGSYPISGSYGSYQYLNWAAKFCIDSLRKELEYDVSSAKGG